MIQDIITIIIVLAAVAYSLSALFRRKSRKRPSACGDCTACSCDLAELKQKHRSEK